MPKTTKPERKALSAIEDAAAAAKFAKQAAKTLPDKTAKKVREAAAEAKDAADVSKKAVRKHPAKIAKRAGKAADHALSVTDAAIAKQQKKADEQRKAAAKKAAEKQKAAAKKAVEKQKAAEKKSARATAKAAEEPAEFVEVILVEAGEALVVEAPQESDEGLSTLTVATLRARARAEGRTGYSRLTKAQLVELLS